MAPGIPILSVRQPWAALIVEGTKPVENRTWRTNYRGPLLIHAGRKPDVSAQRRYGDLVTGALDFGGIVGVVELRDCVDNSASEWAFPEHIHWMLAEARRLPFVAMRGRLGLFRTPAVVADLLMDAASEAL